MQRTTDDRMMTKGIDAGLWTGAVVLGVGVMLGTVAVTWAYPVAPLKGQPLEDSVSIFVAAASILVWIGARQLHRATAPGRVVDALERAASRANNTPAATPQFAGHPAAADRMSLQLASLATALRRSAPKVLVEESRVEEEAGVHVRRDG